MDQIWTGMCPWKQSFPCLNFSQGQFVDRCVERTSCHILYFRSLASALNFAIQEVLSLTTDHQPKKGNN